jgi:diguanylate cyclase with GGDEF domain
MLPGAAHAPTVGHDSCGLLRLRTRQLRARERGGDCAVGLAVSHQPDVAAGDHDAVGLVDVLVGIGTAAEGIEGFRHSHTQAQRALDVALLARPGRLGPAVRYEQVRLLDLLS